jgi:outer membrane protein TolC
LDNIAANALRQRPDVATAEFNLAAASAEIGVARAESYPGLTLMGSVGINSISTGNTSTRASTWSFSPALSIPVLFDGGKRDANRNAADARYHYALAAYQQTVRVAVREIEDTLVRLDVANKRLIQSRETLAQYQEIFNNSEARGKVGLSSQLNKEEATRTELQGRETVLQNQRENVSSWIAVYKALGGGWQDNALIVEKNNEVGK